MMQRNYGRVDDAMPLLDETRARLSVGVFEENEMLHKKIVRGSRNDLHKLVEVLHLLRVDTSGALDQEGSLCKVQRLGSAFKLELDVRNLSECSWIICYRLWSMKASQTGIGRERGKLQRRHFEKEGEGKEGRKKKKRKRKKQQTNIEKMKRCTPSFTTHAVESGLGADRRGITLRFPLTRRVRVRVLVYLLKRKGFNNLHHLSTAQAQTPHLCPSFALDPGWAAAGG